MFLASAQFLREGFAPNEDIQTFKHHSNDPEIISYTKTKVDALQYSIIFHRLDLLLVHWIHIMYYISNGISLLTISVNYIDCLTSYYLPSVTSLKNTNFKPSLPVLEVLLPATTPTPAPLPPTLMFLIDMSSD